MYERLIKCGFTAQMAQDGVIFDSWNSGGEVPLYYWTTERME